MIKEIWDFGLWTGIASFQIMPKGCIKTFLKGNFMSLREEPTKEHSPQGTNKRFIGSI